MTEETVAAAESEAKTTPGNDQDQAGTTTPRPARRRRRRGSGRSGTAGGKQATEGTGSEQPGADSGSPEPEPEASTQEGGASTPATAGTSTRRRRRRGGRGRSGKPAGAAEGSERPAAETADRVPNAAGSKTRSEPAPETSDGGQPKAGTAASRSRSRRGRGGGAGGGGPSKTKETAAAETKPARRRTRPAAGTKPAEKEKAAEEPSRGPTRTARRPRTPGRRRREPQPLPKRERDKIMLITERGDRDQIAVVEGRDLIEHYITRAGAHSMVGNIYLGRVQNVLPGMEAAFVDVGRGRNAVLYAGEVNWDEDVEGQARRIEQALKPGQSVLVQVTKDPLGGKGARLTGEVSVPGRFLVLVPNSQVFGLSRRLDDNERRRLRTLVRKLKPADHGLIVRTAADGASEDDLAADVQRLLATWEDIEKRSKKAKPPKVLYEEPELTVRVVRDLFNDEEFTEIVTDSVPVYDMVRAYLQQVAPDLVENVHLHEGKLPLFEEYHLIEQIHKALERKVWLPSGGYIVIDRTEAMTVIDVNTGRHVGKTNLEETVVKTNVEAAEEIARQLRLRDIGGMIIIDFIDMLFEQNKSRVIQTLKDALAQDKTRSQVFDISPLGLLEVTRKRVSAGLLESFSETCPTCEGRGILITHDIH